MEALLLGVCYVFFSSRRRHTRCSRDWSSECALPIYQTDIGKIQPGQAARVTVEAYPGRPFVGEVVKVEPSAVVDQNVTMFPVLVHLRNDERLLKPGMRSEERRVGKESRVRRAAYHEK